MPPHVQDGGTRSLARPFGGSTGGTFGVPLREWLLYAYSVVYPFFMYSVVFSRDTISLWLVLFMALLVLTEGIRSGGRFWTDTSFRYLGLLFLVYLLTTVILYTEESRNTVLGRTPLDRAMAIDLRLINVVVAFIVFANLLADAPVKVLSTILKIQLYCGAVIACFGILQYVIFTTTGSTALIGIEPTNESFAGKSYIFRISGKRFFRSAAIFNEPSYFGFFLIPLIVKAVAAWMQKFTIGSRRMHSVLLVVFGIAILTNFSFTAVMSVFLLAAIVVILSLRRAPRTSLSLLAAAGIFFGLLVVSPVGDAALQRFGMVFQLRDLSTLDRLLRVYTSFLVFLDNPWLGVGPGGYAFWYTRLGGLDYTIMASPLNLWLSFLTDVGLLGFIPFLLFLGSIVRRALRALDRHPLVGIYLWSVVAYLVLLTTLDVWFADFIWFEFAMLLAVTAGAGIGSTRPVAETVNA
jgi:O-antigen ligase